MVQKTQDREVTKLESAKAKSTALMNLHVLHKQVKDVNSGALKVLSSEVLLPKNKQGRVPLEHNCLREGELAECPEQFPARAFKEVFIRGSLRGQELRKCDRCSATRHQRSKPRYVHRHRGTILLCPTRRVVSSCERTDCSGMVAFQNECDVSKEQLLDLLRCYLDATLVYFEENSYIQKQGICIGYFVAPVLC